MQSHTPYDLARAKMEAFVASCESKIEAKEKESELIKRKVVDLLKVGQKQNAKKLLIRKKKNEELVVQLQKRAAMMEKKIITMEEMQTNAEFVNTIKESNQIINKRKMDAQEAMDTLEQARDLKQQSEMYHQELDDLLHDQEDDDDDIADLMKEYEDQVNEDLKKDFQAADKHILDKKPVLKPAQQQAAPKKKDDFNDLLNGLLN